MEINYEFQLTGAPISTQCGGLHLKELIQFDLNCIVVLADKKITTN